MQYDTYRLLQPLSHGNFTVGRSYPLINLTSATNGQRGFYWDDSCRVRMARPELFDAAPDGVWESPAAPEHLPQKQRKLLANRWGVTPQTVYNYQRREDRAIRWADLLRGASLPVCNDTVDDLKAFVQQHGFYMQELAARWGTQQFGTVLSEYAAGKKTVYFWDLWRGMMMSGCHE